MDSNPTTRSIFTNLVNYGIRLSSFLMIVPSSVLVAVAVVLPTAVLYLLLSPTTTTTTVPTIFGWSIQKYGYSPDSVKVYSDVPPGGI